MTHVADTFLDWLTAGMQRLHQALSRFWNREALPKASQQETYTDQW